MEFLKEYWSIILTLSGVLISIGSVTYALKYVIIEVKSIKREHIKNINDRLDLKADKDEVAAVKDHLYSKVDELEKDFKEHRRVTNDKLSEIQSTSKVLIEQIKNISSTIDNMNKYLMDYIIKKLNGV